MLFDFGGSCLQLCLWTVFLPTNQAEERQVKAGGEQGAKMFTDVQRVTVVSSQGFSAQEGTAKFASAGAAAKGAAALATGHDGHGYAGVVSCFWQEGARLNGR